MPHTNRRCKTVFLIDTHTNDCDSPSNKFNRTVSLSIFRILTYLSSQYQQQNKQIKTPSFKWGYKFFNSSTHSLKVEKYAFKEFKVKYFDEFDRELVKKTCNNVLTTANANSGKVKATETKTSSCECLSRTLTELTHDFEWDTPDLFSPVKKRRNKKKSELSDLDSQNGKFVFLFSKCPKTSASLRHFTKKKVLDYSVFLDSLMPSSLFSLINHDLQLRLFWIDTDIVQDKIDLQSLQLVETAIEKINGKVIPIDAIINFGKPSLSILSDFKVEQKEDAINTDQKPELQGSTFLPFTTIIDYYVTLSRRIPKDSYKKSDSVLRYNGEDICLLKLKPTLVSNDDKNAVKLSQESQLCSTISLTKDSDNITIVHGSHSSNDLLISCPLDVYGLVSKTMGQQACPEPMFVCVACGTDTEERSQVFQKIMAHLINSGLGLILLAKDISKFFLMMPLTSTSATLAPTSAGVILDIERQLMVKESSQSHEEEMTDPKSWGNLVDKLCHSKVQEIQKDKTPESDKKRETEGLFNMRALDKTHLPTEGLFNMRALDKTHLPGCQPPFISLIDKLNQRISQLEFLSDSEVKALKQLQRMYHLESRPPQLINHTPQPKPPVIGQDKGTEDCMNDSLQSRGKMIARRSQLAGIDKPDDKRLEEEPVKQKPRVNKAPDVDFKDELELEKYLNEMYDRSVIDTTGSLYSGVQPLVTIALHYMRESGKDNPQESCAELLNNGVTLSTEKLRQKYQQDSDIDQKIREYQLQIVLRLEIQSMLCGGDQSMSLLEDKIEEIVTLLRTISFITEPKVLSEFMKNSLVENFVHSCPQLLGGIYDELMQPYPPELEAVLSPDGSANDSSVFNQSNQSIDGTPSVSSQPASAVSDILVNRTERRTSRKLVHHPSLVDFGAKRQIVVATKATKDKQQKVEEKRKRRERDKEKRKLERRQSVAVMETVKNSTKKRKTSNILRSPKYLKSPIKKLVSETPSHKQKSQRMWQRLEKERKRTHSVIDVKVVAESPVKKDITAVMSPQKKLLKAQRRSFYSAGPISRSRSLTNSLELADKISGKSNYVKKTKRQSLFSLKSPDRNSSFLLSQLMGSPGTLKKTPGKKLSLTQTLGSPSQNTRSKTPSKVASSQKSLFQSPKRSIKKLSFTPVKTEQKAIVPDSPCLNTRSNTPNKHIKVLSTPCKSPAVSNLLLSPSQNTRSKVTSTPTRHSVKAKLFIRSPEAKEPKSNDKFSGSCINLKGKRALNLNEENCPSSEKQETELIQEDNSKNLKGDNQNTEKTPSPTKKMIIKTPNSLDSWPRKKKWKKIKYEESPKKRPNVNIEECESLKSSKSNTSNEEDEEIIVNDKLDTDDRGTNDLLTSDGDVLPSQFTSGVLHSIPKLSTKRSLALSPDQCFESPAKRKRFSPSKSDGIAKNETLSFPVKEVNRPIVKLSRKRTLDLSQENDVFSPNKRLKSVCDNTESRDLIPQGKAFVKNFSFKSDGILSSQGFETNNISSQGSSQSQDILSIAENDSMDYFSASNDEVFISPTRRSRNSVLTSRSDIDSSKVWPDSPVFGSSKKNRLVKKLTSQELNKDEADNKSAEIQSPGTKTLDSENSMISPSAKKYSPSVSAKSLCHLISSPLLNSPSMRDKKDDTSPKLTQDSLNIRRQKMRIRRSLIQN